MSKAALNHQTVPLAKALGPDLTLNAFAPGLIETPLTTDAIEAHAAVVREAPLLRSGPGRTSVEACHAVVAHLWMRARTVRRLLCVYGLRRTVLLHARGGAGSDVPAGFPAARDRPDIHLVLADPGGARTGMAPAVASASCRQEAAGPAAAASQARALAERLTAQTR